MSLVAIIKYKLGDTLGNAIAIADVPDDRLGGKDVKYFHELHELDRVAYEDIPVKAVPEKTIVSYMRDKNIKIRGASLACAYGNYYVKMNDESRDFSDISTIYEACLRMNIQQITLAEHDYRFPLRDVLVVGTNDEGKIVSYRILDATLDIGHCGMNELKNVCIRQAILADVDEIKSWDKRVAHNDEFCYINNTRRDNVKVLPYTVSAYKQNVNDDCANWLLRIKQLVSASRPDGEADLSTVRRKFDSEHLRQSSLPESAAVTRKLIQEYIDKAVKSAWKYSIKIDDKAEELSIAEYQDEEAVAVMLYSGEDPIAKKETEEFIGVRASLMPAAHLYRCFAYAIIKARYCKPDVSGFGLDLYIIDNMDMGERFYMAIAVVYNGHILDLRLARHEEGILVPYETHEIKMVGNDLIIKGFDDVSYNIGQVYSRIGVGGKWFDETDLLFCDNFDITPKIIPAIFGNLRNAVFGTTDICQFGKKIDRTGMQLVNIDVAYDSMLSTMNLICYKQDKSFLDYNPKAVETEWHYDKSNWVYIKTDKGDMCISFGSWGISDSEAILKLVGDITTTFVICSLEEFCDEYKNVFSNLMAASKSVQSDIKLEIVKKIFPASKSCYGLFIDWKHIKDPMRALNILLTFNLIPIPV